MLGLQYTQAGGSRPIAGTWDILGPGRAEEASADITGTGGKAVTELRQGNTLNYGGAEHTVSSVNDDNSFSLTSPWGGPSGKGVTLNVSGKKPEIKPDAAALAASAPRPVWKNPVVIITVVGIALVLTYFLIRRKKR